MKTTNLILTICITSFNFVMLTNSFAQVPNWAWAKSTGGTMDDVAYSIAADASGNVYTVGFFRSSSIAFGSTNLTNAGGEDVFITKYDANGNPLWAKSAGGSDWDWAASVSVDTSSGNVYVVGSFFSSSISFGSITLINSGGNGGSSIFIVKYDTNGNVLWAKSAVGNAGAKSLKVDVFGNICIGGNFSGSITFGSVTLAGGGIGMFIAKYDVNGNTLWAKNSAGSYASISDDHGVAFDVIGNIYVVGSFIDSVTFGSITLPYSDPSRLRDIFIVKYNSNGNVVWAKSGIGNGENDLAIGVTTDTSGNVYVAGDFFSSSLSFGNIILNNSGTGYADMFVVKYDVNGNPVWAKSAGCNSVMDVMGSIATDAFGNVCVAGWFGCTSITFGSTTLNNASGSYMWDLVLLKYDSNGNVLWAKGAGGNYNDIAYSVSIDVYGNIYIAGYFESSSITFGSTILNNSSAGTDDIFIAKLDAVTGIESLENKNDIFIYPNPFAFETILQIDNLLLHNATLTVDNCFGQTVAQIKIPSTRDGQAITFNRGNLPSGLYFVRLTEENKIIAVDKLVITDK